MKHGDARSLDHLRHPSSSTLEKPIFSVENCIATQCTETFLVTENSFPLSIYLQPFPSNRWVKKKD